MHGSIGWYEHSGYMLGGGELDDSAKTRQGKTVVQMRNQLFGVPPIDSRTGELLRPLILTPVLNKPFEQHPIYRTIWSEAKKELGCCKRLVIGGYSFPPTDFHVRRLLRQVFCDSGPKDLRIINPDTNIVEIARELCNYHKPISICTGIEEYGRYIGEID